MRVTLLRTYPGRLFLIATLALLVLLGAQELAATPDWVEAVRKLVSLVFWITGGWVVVSVFRRQRHQFLWRVRRKLLISYVFLGLVPVGLVVAFVLAGSSVFYTDVAAYVFHDGFADLQDVVRATAGDLARDVAGAPGNAGPLVTSRLATLTGRYPDLSVAIRATASVDPSKPPRPAPTFTAGAWRHGQPPATVPDWISQAHGYNGLVPLEDPSGAVTELVVRSVAPVGDGRLIVVDLPLDDVAASALRLKTGMSVRQIVIVNRGTVAGPPAAAQGRTRAFQQTTALIDYQDWSSGAIWTASVRVDAPPSQLYQRLAAATVGAAFAGSAWQGFLVALLVVGGLLFVILSTAMFFGLGLIRQITSAVHEFSIGTERLQAGDYTHRIPIRTRDQLGELAEQFNSMSGTVAHTFQLERAKQRLDDELRIARDIQRSLLPAAVPRIAGLSVADLCEPAREVGGDYYDFFELAPRQLGVLVADVSGKGTSAALYMAELKGLMLALSHTERSPRRLLITLNRLLAGHLDNRSFITMIYAVVDLEAGTLTCARAGHTPLVVASGGRSEIVAPDGMVLGLRLPGASDRFESLLQEHTRPIKAGDAIVLYTDGITEAMNVAGDLFGDAALADLLASHHHLDAPALRERVVRDVRAFVGDAEPHDDMTMVVLKLDETGAAHA